MMTCCTYVCEHCFTVLCTVKKCICYVVDFMMLHVDSNTVVCCICKLHLNQFQFSQFAVFSLMSVKLLTEVRVDFVVSGFGFGVISGAFSLVNVLADMTGPGTVGIFGHSSHFFISSGIAFCHIVSVQH